MYSIGSGDVKFLLAKNKNTATYKNFLAKFFNIYQPTYNAKLSPIDALRTGAILEDQYYKYLDDSWVDQVKVQSKEYDVLISTIDFAKVKNGNVTEFQEVKSIDYDKFILLDNNFNCKKSKKDYYNQIQHQLYCSELEKATLTFISRFEYDDEYNKIYNFREQDIKKYTIYRDEKVIKKIVDACKPFQYFKDNVFDKGN